ncbi:MAG: ROK family transcriptional regulator, partial [Myxococcota bacterium]
MKVCDLRQEGARSRWSKLLDAVHNRGSQVLDTSARNSYFVAVPNKGTAVLHQEPPRKRPGGPTSRLGQPPRLTPRTWLLRLVWEYREISRADIARRTGLSRSTVSTVMSELLDSGIVEETRQGSSNGGRRPIMVGFRDNARTVLGVDVGASHIDAVLTNLRGEILERGSRVMPTRDAPEATLDAITTMARQLIKASPAPCLGVGVGLPSPVHPSSGRVPREVLPRWSEVDVAQALFERIDRPVRIDNDANLGALAELWWGAGRGGDDLVFVKVATGIGAGLIVNGRIVRGAHGFAGEVGHLSSDPNGPPCICGVNGCLNVIMGTEA